MQSLKVEARSADGPDVVAHVRTPDEVESEEVHVVRRWESGRCSAADVRCFVDVSWLAQSVW